MRKVLLAAFAAAASLAPGTAWADLSFGGSDAGSFSATGSELFNGVLASPLSALGPLAAACAVASIALCVATSLLDASGDGAQSMARLATQVRRILTVAAFLAALGAIVHWVAGEFGTYAGGSALFGFGL